MLDDDLEDILELAAPSTVILVCGENDLWGQSVSKTFKHFKKVVKKIEATGARVIYMGTKPEPDTTSLHDEYQEYDALIRSLAAEYGKCT